MRIQLALLADHALAHSSDGKLYVTGGGIRTLTFPAFPGTYPHLALALGIELGAEELGQEHLLMIDTSGPTGEPILRPVQVTFRVPSRGTGGEDGHFHFVSNMDNVRFPGPGDYAFAVSIDEQRLETVLLRIRQGVDASDDAEGANIREAEALVASGFQAFVEGDADRAEELFRAAIARAARLAAAHNNLGFILLSKGEAVGAREAFVEARRLGFPQNELSDANLACAYYVEGNATAARDLFVDCLRTHVFTGRAVLFGIGPGGLFPVGLDSAADYAALIGLNAAWSSNALGDEEAKTQYLAVARAGEPGLRDSVGGTLFGEAVQSLSAL